MDSAVCTGEIERTIGGAALHRGAEWLRCIEEKHHKDSRLLFDDVMNRSSAYVSLAFLLYALASSGCDSPSDVAQAVVTTSQPPNVVFILIDDMGWPDLPAYGNRFNEAPSIDRLAQDGMRLTDAYAAAPVCSPTRASIQSGQYPAHVGITDFIPGHWRPYEKVIAPKNRTQYLPPDIVTVGEALGDAGYTTGYFGKWHLGDPDLLPDDQGYDSSLVYRGWGHFDLAEKLIPSQDVEPEAYLTEVLTDRSLEFMEANRSKPFFLTLSHFAVHIPLEARQELIEKYEKKVKPHRGVNNPIYAAMIEHVDNSVGRVLDGLDELGLADNTVVVLFSDNGGLRERFDRADGIIVSTNDPLRDEKGSLYEGGIREPLIVRWPGQIEAGSVSDAIVSSVDLYPTFLDVAGADAPDAQELDGISLLPVLRGEEPDPDRAVFWHYPHYHHDVPGGAVRLGDYKLIESYEDGGLELYNLADDLGERKNLADEMPEKTRELQTLLEAWREDVGAEMPIANPEFDPQRRYEWGTHPDRAEPPEFALDKEDA